MTARTCKVLLCLWVMVVILSGCNKEPDKTTKTQSTQFLIKRDKIEFLKKYIKSYSEIIDAEYSIDYFDNSTGMIPGPSDYDIRVALKVPKSAISAWLDGYNEVAEKDINLLWWGKIIPNTEEWKISAKPKYYQRGKHFAYLVLYQDEGIILKANTTMAYLDK